MRAKIRPLLVDVHELDSDGDELVSFCCGKDIKSYIELTEERIKRAINEEGEKASRLDYQVIPFKGISGIAQAVTTQEDFHKIVEKVLEWRKEYLSFNYELKYIIKSLVEIQDEHNKPRLNQWISSELAKENSEAFDNVFFFISLSE